MNPMFPNIVEYKQSNGLNVIFVPNHDFPVIVANAVFPVGSLSDKKALAGCNDLLASLVIKGSKKYSSDNFSDTIESKGAAVFAESAAEHTLLGIKMLSKYQDELLPLFFDMLHNPEMPKNIFSRLKKEFVSALSVETTNSPSVAEKHFQKIIFGEDHPAGNIQTIKSVTQIKLRDVEEKYESDYSLNGAYFIIGGAFSVNSMKKLISKEMGYSSNNVIAENNYINPAPCNSSTIRIVDNPSLSQSTYICGHTAPSECSENRIPLSVANYILGGGNFSSRLMKSIRSRFGKTYGISSVYKTFSKYGLFYIMTSTQNSQLNSVVDSINECYREFVANGPTEEELENAKQYIHGSLKFELEGTPKIINTLMHLKLYGRSNNYLQEYLKKVESLTVSDIKKVLNEEFRDKKLSAVAVGKYSEMEGLSDKFESQSIKNFKENP